MTAQPTMPKIRGNPLELRFSRIMYYSVWMCGKSCSSLFPTAIKHINSSFDNAFVLRASVSVYWCADDIAFTSSWFTWSNNTWIFNLTAFQVITPIKCMIRYWTHTRTYYNAKFSKAATVTCGLRLPRFTISNSTDSSSTSHTTQEVYFKYR